MPYLRVKNELPLIPGYASGNIIRLSDAAAAPLNMLKLSVEASQAGSGDPSPENIRPITGYSQAVITQSDGDNTVITKTASFGQTLYGADIDLLNGTGTIKYGFYEFDGTETAIAYGSGFRYVVLTGKESESYGGVEIPDMNSNKFVPVNRNQISSGVEGASVTGDTVLLSTDSPAGVQIRYKLATPIPITFTPMANIETLLGYNQIFADCGPIELKYIRRLDS